MVERDHERVARPLMELGQRLLLAKQNPYRARAYSRAAENLLQLVPLEDVIARDRLREIPGVGPALESVIRQLWHEGTTPKLEALRARGAARQTERMIAAVRNPHTTILGHLTARMLLRREGYELDIDAVLRSCAEHGVAVEINANPHRLDLDWRWYRRAIEYGCWLSINPDAHSTKELELTRCGVMVARKGTVPKERVLNCLDRAEHDA